MVKCASIYTYEVDDAEVALQEINAQLVEKIKLLNNTVGIIMCHPEFVGSGVAAYIGKNLPFDVAGVTTSSQAVNGEASELILTVFIITSDDTYFRCGLTGPLEGSIFSSVKDAYQKASEGLAESPKLILAFPPLLPPTEEDTDSATVIAGDTYVTALDRMASGVPIFGSVSIDDTISFNDSRTLLNGEEYVSNMVFVLCYGSINPRFAIATFPEDSQQLYKGEVTKSDGVFVKEINDVSAVQYFSDLGLINSEDKSNLYFVPILIDQKQRGDYDGIPVLRVIVEFLNDGSARFNGNVDEHSTLSLLKWNTDNIYKASKSKFEEISEIKDVNGLLVFSCIIRRMMIMQTDSMQELNGANQIFHGFPFMMGYAGGEICPSSVRNGTAANRFHNYSLVMLIL